MDEYKVLAPYPKWMLDSMEDAKTGDAEQADRRARIAQETPVSVRLAKVRERAPIIANTEKPQGVKKARKTIK